VDVPRVAPSREEAALRARALGGRSRAVTEAPPPDVETAHSPPGRRAAGLLERSDDDGRPPILRGHFAVFDEWTEINSLFEGRFLERFAPGAFQKTLRENKRLRVLFQHGHDPELGDKPIAEWVFLWWRDAGAEWTWEALGK